MSNNQGTVTDSDGDYSDWIELYNTSASPVNLLNWGLSDNVDSLFKWRFPNYTLNAGSFLRIWCSGKNRAVTTPFHTSFSIDSRGETIYLSDSTGAVQDNLLAIYMPPDRSFGRLPNGSVNQFYLSVATPAASNNFATAFQGAVTEPVTFSLAGGFILPPRRSPCRIPTLPSPSVIPSTVPSRQRIRPNTPDRSR